MKIFFTVSKSGIKNHLGDYKKVLKELGNQRVKVEATLIKTYLKKPFLKKIPELVNQEGSYKYVHDSAIRKAIIWSDAVIIEASYPSFRLGFEAYFALAQQKPVLILSKTRNYGNLIDQPNFFGAKYTDFTLPDEIEKFIRHVREYKLRNRFNLFISDKHKVHLEKMAVIQGVSMSDYVRKLVERDMNSDLDFRK